jgi:hypothetical protein
VQFEISMTLLLAQVSIQSCVCMEIVLRKILVFSTYKDMFYLCRSLLSFVCDILQDATCKMLVVTLVMVGSSMCRRPTTLGL